MPKPKRRTKARTSINGWMGEDVDSELLDEAIELASNREGTCVPGNAAIRAAIRDLLEARRRRSLSNEAREALGFDPNGEDEE